MDTRYMFIDANKRLLGRMERAGLCLAVSLQQSVQEELLVLVL